MLTTELKISFPSFHITSLLKAYQPSQDKTLLCHMRTTKAQVSLHICTVWSAPYYTCYIQNFKTPDIFCSWAVQFESNLVTNPEDRFSRDMAHMVVIFALHQHLFSKCSVCLIHKRYACLWTLVLFVELACDTCIYERLVTTNAKKKNVRFRFQTEKKLGMVGRNNILFCQNILFSMWCQNCEAARKTRRNIVPMTNTATQLIDMRCI